MGTREHILAVGRQLLVEDGLRAITTNAVAQQARISKKTLYRHFSSKDALIEEIVVSLVEENLDRWDRILESDNSAIDRILASLQFAGQFLPHIQTQLINQVESVAPNLWPTIDAIRMKRLVKLKNLVQEAQQDGFLREDIDPDHWILLFSGAIQSVVTPQVLLSTGIPLNDLLDSIRIIYYDGLLTDEGRSYVATRERK